MKTKENYLPSLIRNTPMEGQELTIKLDRKSMGAIQTDPEIWKKLRPAYAAETAQLVASAEVIGLELKTIAEATKYWSDGKK